MTYKVQSKLGSIGKPRALEGPDYSSSSNSERSYRTGKARMMKANQRGMRTYQETRSTHRNDDYGVDDDYDDRNTEELRKHPRIRLMNRARSMIQQNT